MLKIAIDIGGTFTDVVAETEHGFSSLKILTSAAAPEVAALAGVDELLQRLSARFKDIDSVVHGTTLATNALIERRGAKTALITTAGFRDVLEMRNEKRFSQYDLNIKLPIPLIPRPLRVGVQERTLADGRVLIKPDDAEINAVCQRLLEQDVTAVAIGFLHAYRNSANENHVATRIQAALGNKATVCQSAEVACEIREFERFSTVCANAYVRPLMNSYLTRLETEFLRRGFAGSFLMMLSDGALTTLAQAKRFPIRLVEGGPAGGVALGAHVAGEMQIPKVLSLDIGGTTAKICFIENAKAQTTRSFEVARSWRDTKGSGLPIKVPTVELVEIGAGGGSIVSVDSLGRLKTGPQSAGSDPGPACYNLGGNNATVTDAHVVLGGIVPEGFAEGKIQLIPQLALNAISDDIQSKLELEAVEVVCAGIVELANETMANAARVHGIELGLDVSSFDLLVSGGGGGLHATRIAEKLGIQRIIVPAHAGVGSAVGFLRSPIAFQTPLPVLAPLATIDYELLQSRLTVALRDVKDIVSQAVMADHISTSVIAELRYSGQGLELRETLNYAGNLNSALDEAQRLFKNRYQALFGYTLDHIDIELVSLSVSAQEKFQPNEAKSESMLNDSRGEYESKTKSDVEPATDAESLRKVYDYQDKAFRETPVVARAKLTSEVVHGPLVIAELQTTTIVPNQWCVHHDESNHMIIQRCS